MKISNWFDINDSRQLSRLVKLALAAVLILIVVFSGYYYWDRYIHLGDKSPLDIGVEHLEEMVRENPEDPEARIALAQYYYEYGVYDKAIEQSQQVRSAYPDNDSALFILGMSYIQAGQTEAAFEPLEQFAASRQESPMAQSDTTLETVLYFLGQAYVQTNQPDKAVTVLVKALEINHTDADAMYQLGLAYATNGRHDLAVQQYQNAVRFVPDFTEAYAGMAESYKAQGMQGHVTYASGMEAFAQKDYESARAYLESAVANLPDFAPAYLGLGLVQEQLGNLQEAQANLEHVLELEPGDFMANHAIGRIQLTLSETE